jgi:hypothetical protein
MPKVQSVEISNASSSRSLVSPNSSGVKYFGNRTKTFSAPMRKPAYMNTNEKMLWRLMVLMQAD